MSKRPLAVTIIGCVYIAIGIIGFGYHLTEISAANPPTTVFYLIEAVRLLALVCGIFILRAQNWARWIAIAWIAAHVIISIFHSPFEVVIHAVFCALIAWSLCYPEATRYFRRMGPTPAIP